MEYLDTFNIYDFQFWAGGKIWADEFAKQHKYNVLEDMILSVFEGTTPTKTEINDYVWFDEELHALVDEESKQALEEGNK